MYSRQTDEVINASNYERSALRSEAKGTERAVRPTFGKRCNVTVRNSVCRNQSHTARTSRGYSGKSENTDDRKCYKCWGVWNLARECPTRQNRLNPRNPPSNSIGNAMQESAKTVSGSAEATQGTEKWSGDSSLNISPRKWCRLVCSESEANGRRTHYTDNFGFSHSVYLETGSST